ncbi:hypothetical protein BBF96_05715 [Anoxybacter fermentans]|uniref:Solute-binding protein family 5 domain-containing protein n=1 Tax=Anoxybacter fermentans TaxID=1323375 RepID=A0A3S9SXF9_9FIRM|nr:peptide ABC transporter substrate-binding protein [Anoxybacter fermentans]AZR72932.1 hypothetical protein BBF96_05715 [Anoxybacter fermentans]
MSQKRFVIFLAILLTLCVVSSVALSKEKVLQFAMTQEPDGFGPMFSMVAGTTVEGLLDIGLLYRDNNWDLHPAVALYRPSVEDGTWIVNDDGTMEVHWKIRDDVYWHDGVKHTIHDYVFGFEVGLDEEIPIVSRYVTKKIDHIEVINDYECIVYWKELYPFADLTINGQGALPRHILEEVYRTDKEKFINHPYWTNQFIGRGPYKLKDWVPGSHIEVVKNENFFIAEPKIDRIIARFVEDTETLAVMIKTGEVDATLPPTVPFDVAMNLKKSVDPNEINIEFVPGVVWEHIDLNKRDYPPFRDPRVRKALLYAIDRQKLVDALFDGVLPVAHTFMAPRHPLYTDAVDKVIKKYEYNPEKALALMAMAGWTIGEDGILENEKGEKMILNIRTTSGNRPRELTLQVLQDMWKKIGVKLEIEVMPPAVLFNGDHFYRREWPHMIMFAWVSYPTSMPLMWHSDQIPTEENGWSGQNIAGWANEEADKIIEKMLVEMSEKKRQELNVELMKLWTEDLPSLPLFFRVDIATWKTNVKGIKPTGSADPYTWNCWEWDIE